MNFQPKEEVIIKMQPLPVTNNVPADINLAHLIDREEKFNVPIKTVTTKYSPFVVTLLPDTGPVGTRFNKTTKQCSVCNANIEFEYRQETVVFTTPNELMSAKGKLFKSSIISYLLRHGTLLLNLLKSLTAFSERPLITIMFLLICVLPVFLFTEVLHFLSP